MWSCVLAEECRHAVAFQCCSAQANPDLLQILCKLSGQGTQECHGDTNGLFHAACAHSHVPLAEAAPRSRQESSASEECIRDPETGLTASKPAQERRSRTLRTTVNILRTSTWSFVYLSLAEYIILISFPNNEDPARRAVNARLAARS